MQKLRKKWNDPTSLCRSEPRLESFKNACVTMSRRRCSSHAELRPSRLYAIGCLNSRVHRDWKVIKPDKGHRPIDRPIAWSLAPAIADEGSSLEFRSRDLLLWRHLSFHPKRNNIRCIFKLMQLFSAILRQQCERHVRIYEEVALPRKRFVPSDRTAIVICPATIAAQCPVHYGHCAI